MTADRLTTMIREEAIHTRPKSVRSSSAKTRVPPAVVITDDSDTPVPVTDIACSLSDSISAHNVKCDGNSSAKSQTLADNDNKPNGVCSIRSSGGLDIDIVAQSSPATELLGESNQSTNQGDADNQPYMKIAGRQCCTEHGKKVTYGIILTTVIATAWVGTVHLLKITYTTQPNVKNAVKNTTENQRMTTVSPSTGTITYSAPFFTTWFCSMWNCMFFPIFLSLRPCSSSEKTTVKKILIESIQNFQEKNFTLLQFFGRCCLFSLLWVISNYMIVHSLKILGTTEVMALFSSNVCFVYLLSWVILHEKFVGIRRIIEKFNLIIFVQVLFKKLIGEVSFGQLSLFFTIVGFLDALMLWPLVLTLYFTGAEVIIWSKLPWYPLGGAALLSLLANILGNLGVVWTYEVFLILGFLFAVPASAVIDVYRYNIKFYGMKLAGIILIVVGFLLVLLPDDWPDYLTMVLRWRRNKYTKDNKANKQQDMRSAQTSRLRTLSGRVK
ncbi:putative thiamine transporter SLC35F3 [Centruroides sculpturatus]|uniref:putative thiamine transporter SLC35F3 n=1 Tax=Centruroides sculpturatus TaxID=218467 RepID=UPI000C6E74B8|nr:putative thiamine transporter SLC35F3 [Centruroides sculpturatus]